MQRSGLVLAGILLVGCAPSRSAPPSIAGAVYPPSTSADREILPDEQILQALNRLAFGPRPGDVAAVRAMGVDRWIQLQLSPEAIRDDAATRAIGRYPTLSANRREMYRAFEETRQARNQAQRQAAAMGDTANRRDIRRDMATADPMLSEAQQMVQRAVPELQAAILTRAVVSERQLYEVMVNFWENHFSVFANKGPQARVLLTEYDRDVIRPNAMGKFRTLLGAVAHSPAMLFYLDNAQSQADSTRPTLAGARGGNRRLTRPNAPRQRRGLNENYARELLELHTLGVDGGYTQNDVIEVARALTGWSIAVAQGGEYIFRPEAHDAAEKVVLGHRLRAGRGEEDGEEVLNIVARHPSTAKFITTKLARHFIADVPPASVVDRCAAVFSKTDGDIRQTVGCIVTGPEFFSRGAYRAKVKTPFQLVASALRAVGAEPDATPRSAQAVAQLGQPIFGRQTPDGWPDRADAWMNTGAILGRINFGQTMAAGRVPGVTMGRVPELEQLANAPRTAQVDGVVKLLFGGQVSPDTRAILLSGENPLAATLSPDSASMSRGGGMPPDRRRPLGGGRGQGRGPEQSVALQGVAQVIGLALGAPEFQRR